MIGVFVTFRYEAALDVQALRNIAETGRARFEEMAGLRSKAFTMNCPKREAVNFYLWDSEEAANRFFTDAVLARIADLYGVRPSVEFVHVAALVDNVRHTVPG